jgi:DNA-binding response OmpR family regulator
MDGELSDSGAKTAFPGARILVVDDEKALRRTLSGLLGQVGYQVTSAASGAQALEYLAAEPFDLVILDLKMPGLDGVKVLEAARPQFPETVFIILTAHGTLDTAIAALRQGAFDYLLKPSPVPEILRAVEAGLAECRRRRQQQDPVQLLEQALVTLKEVGTVPQIQQAESRPEPTALTVDRARKVARVRGQAVHLTPTEFDLLTYLLDHPNQVVSCRELASVVHGYDLDERDARLLLRSHIHRLRQKIEDDPAHPQRIRTHRGSGYLYTP